MTLIQSSKMTIRREVSLVTRYFILKLTQLNLKDDDTTKLSMAVHLLLDKAYSMRKTIERLTLTKKQVIELRRLFPTDFFPDLNKLKRLIAKQA